MEQFSLDRLADANHRVREAIKEADAFLYRHYGLYIRVLQVKRSREEHKAMQFNIPPTTTISYEDTWHNPDRPGNEAGVLGVDMILMPFVADDWNTPDLFFILYGVMLVFAAKHGLTFIWGGDWNNNHVYSRDKTQNWDDLPHHQFQLAGQQ